MIKLQAKILTGTATKKMESWAQWLTRVIPVPRTLKQEDHVWLEASLDSTANSQTARGYSQAFSKRNRQMKEES